MEWCERKILLADWWLEAGAGAVQEENTIELETAGAAEQSVTSSSSQVNHIEIRDTLLMSSVSLTSHDDSMS